MAEATVNLCALMYAARRSPALVDVQKRPAATFLRCWLPTVLCGVGATIVIVALG